MERNVNGKGNRAAATWDLRKTALFCLASRFCKLPESSATGNQHWSCPKSLLLLSWELVLEPLMELLCLVIFTSCDIEINAFAMTQWNRLLILCCSLLSHKSPGSPKSSLTIVAPSSSLHSSRRRCLLLPGITESLHGVAASPLSEASPLLHGVLASPLFSFYLAASASLSWLIVDCASLLLLCCCCFAALAVCGLSSVENYVGGEIELH
ncbi:uncharacterized protein LOC107637787 [Arachis ipaensis]|uniref:uncharacterized protein LOC107637787 n=1 Tax=Arachis ipaensis TaxID=130454 RepID=UPI000A2B1560|nr:uncharacterized protein LOC107637787 [Arachis ipaensis]